MNGHVSVSKCRRQSMLFFSNLYDVVSKYNIFRSVLTDQCILYRIKLDSKNVNQIKNSPLTCKCLASHLTVRLLLERANFVRKYLVMCKAYTDEDGLKRLPLFVRLYEI